MTATLTEPQVCCATAMQDVGAPYMVDYKRTTFMPARTVTFQDRVCATCGCRVRRVVREFPAALIDELRADLSERLIRGDWWGI